ncbi:MAG: dicarboxylate/amino acid:cation symporter [Myxococcota bacterium]
MKLYTKILLGMVAGVGLGLLFGPNGLVFSPDAVRLQGDAGLRATPEGTDVVPLAQGAERAVIVGRRGDMLEVEITLRTTDLMRLRRDKVEGAQAAEPGTRVKGWVNSSRPEIQPYARWGQTIVDATEWLGRLFLALIKMVVVPLVFFSLTVGVASLGDFRKLGRLGARTLLFFSCTTVVALVVGVGLTNLIRPGGFLTEDDRSALLASYAGEADLTMGRAASAPSLVDQLIGIVPTNPVGSLAEGDMLQIIFFALMFGVALTLLDDRRSEPLVKMMSTANDAVVEMVHLAMKLAPLGVAALLFKVVGSTGTSVLLALGAYGLVVLGGLLVHTLATYGTLVTIGARIRFLDFLKAIRPALLLAFSTSSSSATLPVTKECVEDNLGVSNQVSSFVLPLGATINMDGTALYQGVAAIFIAQIYGLDLTLVQQLTIITSATLASVGAAGVPGAGLVTLVMVLTTVGVPSEGLALILGVDRLLDMFRTTTNVVGDSSASVFIARLEGEPLRYRSSEEDAADPHRGFEGRVARPKPVTVED